MCLNLEQQVLNTELNDKYKTVEDLVAKKTEELADARRKAGMLQEEAKALLAQANSKLQLLRGKGIQQYQEKSQLILCYRGLICLPFGHNIAF